MNGMWSPKWMIVGQFGNPSSGKIIRLSGTGLSRTMAAIGPEFHVQDPVLIQTGFSEGLDIKFSRPRDFGWGQLPNKVNLWASLIEIAENLEKGRQTPTQAWKQLESLMEATPWWSELQIPSQNKSISDRSMHSESNQPVTPLSSSRNTVREFTGVDSLFSKVSWPSMKMEPSADTRHALDGFVRSMFNSEPQDDATTRKELVRRIRNLVGQGVAAIWTDPMVQQSQSLWKGLHFLVGQNSGQQSTTIDLLDATNDQALEMLFGDSGSLCNNFPDGIFLSEEPTFESFKKFLEFADSAQVPLVVPVDSWLQIDSQGHLSDQWPDHKSSEDWLELRRHPGAAWTCAVANPFVVSYDQHPGVDHVVFSPASLAIAAMLTASYSQTNSFAHFGDRQVPIVLPAIWIDRDCKSGKTREQATRTLVSVPVKSQLSERGIVTIVNGSRITEIRADGQVSLAARDDGRGIASKIIVGKVIRSILEALEELPATSNRQAICNHCRLEVERALCLAHPLQLEINPHGDGDTHVFCKVELPSNLTGTPIRTEFMIPINR